MPVRSAAIWALKLSLLSSRNVSKPVVFILNGESSSGGSEWAASVCSVWRFRVRERVDLEGDEGDENVT